jgi:hypothetical protein
MILYIKIQFFPHREESISIIKINQLMFIWEITSIYSERRKYSLCGQNLELRNIAAGGWAGGGKYRQLPLGCERFR